MEDNNQLKGETNTKKGAVSNTIRLDAENPIPIEFNSNVYVSLKGKRYVPFLNPRDTFFQLLSEASLLSPTTNSCINSKAKYCLGHGVSFKDRKDDDPLVKEFNKWAASVNRKQESLNDIIKGAFSSKFRMGNAFIHVVAGEVMGNKSLTTG